MSLLVVNMLRRIQCAHMHMYTHALHANAAYVVVSSQ